MSILLAAALLSWSQVAPAWSLGPFVRPPDVNPIIAPRSESTFDCPMQGKPVAWEANDTFNPAATVRGKQIVVLYRAEDKSGVGIGARTSRIGHAASRDGTHFERRAAPVLFPAGDDQKANEWPGGCEDPRVVCGKDGTYVMTYTQWNQQVPRLAVATSRDLIHWKKHGPAFQRAFGGKFANIASKSASVITEVQRDRQTIAKIQGKYWMYWGEQAVYGATSEDLTNWTPLVDDQGNLKPLMETRPGFFDSDLTECGPPAVLTSKGIVLIYNGKNSSGARGDSRFTRNSYCAGQALFDPKDPTHFLTRLDTPFFKPTEAFEKSGQYVDGTVFTEGLVWFKKAWFLYYGCADSRVAVAVWKP